MLRNSFLFLVPWFPIPAKRRDCQLRGNTVCVSECLVPSVLRQREDLRGACLSQGGQLAEATTHTADCFSLSNSGTSPICDLILATVNLQRLCGRDVPFTTTDHMLSRDRLKLCLCPSYDSFTLFALLLSHLYIVHLFTCLAFALLFTTYRSRETTAAVLQRHDRCDCNDNKAHEQRRMCARTYFLFLQSLPSIYIYRSIYTARLLVPLLILVRYLPHFIDAAVLITSLPAVGTAKPPQGPETYVFLSKLVTDITTTSTKGNRFFKVSRLVILYVKVPWLPPSYHGQLSHWPESRRRLASAPF